MNEENLRKLYERLGIAEAPPAPPPRPLPAPVAPAPLDVVAEPPIELPAPPPFRPPESVPSAIDRFSKTRVTLSLPVLVLSLGTIALGLFLVSRGSGEPAPPPPPVARVPEPTPPPPPAVEPMAPSIPQPIAPPAPPPEPTPAPAPPEPPPPPPEPTPAERRAALFRKNGSTEESESAVGLALDWLSRHQAATGEWEAMHFERRCPRVSSCQVPNATGDPLYTPGVTGLALLAFMGAGHSPSSGPHAKGMSLGLAWLAERQDAEGGFKNHLDKMVLTYNQAVVTRAMCEAARLTGDARYRNAAQKGLDYLGRTQGADGGWTYYPDTTEPERNDASIAGWVALAIRAAEEAGLKPPEEMKGRLRSFFVRRTDVATGEVIYSNRDPGTGRRGAGLVGLGIFVRGWTGDEVPEVATRAAARLLAARPDWNLFQAAQERSARKEFPFSPDQNLAAWYYGTEAMFLRGGEDWKAWNEAVREALVRNQVRDGHPGGSWEPEFSYIGREGGRVFSTAAAVLILTIYGRER